MTDQPVHAFSHKMAATPLGMRPFTDVCFVHQGVFYGSRYQGTLSPGQIQAEGALFKRRRAAEIGIVIR